MSIKIASLFAEIGADTTKLKAGLNETKTSLGQAKETFKTLATGATAAIGGITVAALAMKKAFDFGMEGAQILYTQQKFDRLSKSIGTTSDVLMIDLKKATGGMISDSKLAASATDLMALGLVKTREEAIRLTTVAGKLGMDMNQLVLTLTNQTTMRFDALGVSVDGFKERLQALKATGMDTNEAFKEAFLQQAEEQVNKVGDSADSAIAPYLRLQAAWQNLGDTVKTGLSEPITYLVEGLTTTITAGKRATDAFKEHEYVMRTNAQTYQDYVDETIRSRTVFDSKARSIYKLSEAMEDNRSIMNYMIEEVGMLSEAQFYNSKRWGENAEQMRGYYETMYNVSGQSLEFIQTSEAVNENIRMQKEYFNALTDQAASGYYTILPKLKEAQDEFNASMQAFNEGTGQQAVGLLGERLYEGGVRYASGLRVLDEVLGTNYAKQNEYNLALEAATNQYAQTGDMEAYEQALINIRDEFGPSSEELDNLAETAGIFRQNMSELYTLSQKKFKFDIEYNITGMPSWWGGWIPSDPSTTGNSDSKRPGVTKGATGADFIVPAGYSNDSYPMLVQSGEHVTVTPTSAGDQDDRLESLLNSLPRQIAVAVRDAVLQGVA
jgi:hypothetical protein